MEEDDEFGDLYTDILIPTQTPASTSALSNPVPVETLPRQPPNPNPTPLAAAAAEEDDDDWLLGGSDPIPGVDPTGDWADEDDDGGEPAPPVKREVAAPAKRPTSADDIDPLMGGGAGDSGPAIPGLSSSAAAGAAGSDEWDSDSEDDIQIVLNETDGRRGLGEDEGDDEDGEDHTSPAWRSRIGERTQQRQGQKESERTEVSLVRRWRHREEGSGTVAAAQGSISSTIPCSRSVIWAKKPYDALWPPLQRETA
jgi:hypothetical protein